MTEKHKPYYFAERIRLAGIEWAEAKRDAKVAEKSAKRKFAALLLASEQTSDERRKAWATCQKQYQDADDKATQSEFMENTAKAELDALNIAFEEWRSMNATKRAEAKATG